MKLDRHFLVTMHPHAFIKVTENFHCMVISTAWNCKTSIKIHYCIEWFVSAFS